MLEVIEFSGWKYQRYVENIEIVWTFCAGKTIFGMSFMGSIQQKTAGRLSSTELQRPLVAQWLLHHTDSFQLFTLSSLSLTPSPAETPRQVISCPQRKHGDRRPRQQVGFVWVQRQPRVRSRSKLRLNGAGGGQSHRWRLKSSPPFRLPHTPGSGSPAGS